MNIYNPAEGHIKMTTKVLDSIRQHTFACLPEEACGVLLGQTSKDNQIIDEYIPVRNTASDPRHHFSLDPVTWTSLVLKEPRICGLFHSHPASFPIPSWEDISQLQYFGSLLQIYFIGTPNLFVPDDFNLEAYQIMKEPTLQSAWKSNRKVDETKRYMLRPLDYVISCST
ncbi:Mov34/MPN/PAD-1 family protein [Paenibacillus sp. EC2-1]|uniref:Mov34/MPN/PAD-1 family protein n=1 Tax=Paenibacillus sp. EC2-1 TaxID=3388665 RepID=UPI003BEEBBC7